ncbi:MAG: hypothetical protein A2174_01285 [Candidatus Portnoybacteria bacterium RBG_13_41_18]|uniref:Prepilin-type N-terminal cleavage/methylation domain-containing protein n=1 Tax=Candidatus Portnoybacteria bacterium RBG_13_41_18 TaxID=1801991 RepID=A0A1G2F5U6_9BACT|nr:MAG: hypothetical protein A2174_01285 [Candidatus Portnoybacteria bacterium RBG_13_41_18]
MKFLKHLIEKSKKASGGFTLIEMLVYLTILVIIMGTIVIFGVMIIRTGAKIKVNAEVMDNGRRALNIMAYEIKKAQSIYSPTIVFDANPGQLSLEQSVSQPAEETKTYVDFFKCGDRLCLKREDEDALNITSDKVRVTNLVFSKLSNSTPSIQISLRIESLAAPSPYYSSSVDLTTTVDLGL